MAERGPLPAAARSPLRPLAHQQQTGPRARAGVEAATRRPCQPRRLLRASARCRSRLHGSRLLPPRSPCSRSPGRERTPTAHNTHSRSGAPLGLQWRRSHRQRPGASRGSLARTAPGGPAPRAQILPNMEPAHGAGVREKSARGRKISREEGRGLGSRGRNSWGLGSSGRQGWRPPRGARAPLCGQTGECLAPRRKAAVTASGKRAKRSLNSEPPAHWSRQFPRTTCKNRQALSRKLSRSRQLKDKWLTSGCR